MKTDPTGANAEYWNEPCGSHAAKVLGVKDASIESLRKFDAWYFGFYPYLTSYIPFAELSQKDVLEVGLGYGSVSQRLAESGCRFVGLDIARGPVDLVNHRLQQNGLQGHAKCGSILDPPFDRNTFDCIVSIGCFHHTGDMEQCITRSFELLRDGGTLVFMVYSAYSYSRWLHAMRSTLVYCWQELRGFRGPVAANRAIERAAYDLNSSGREAPHTDFISKKSLASLCARFSSFEANYENVDNMLPSRVAPRSVLLRTPVPRLAGLDIYARAVR